MTASLLLGLLLAFPMGNDPENPSDVELLREAANAFQTGLALRDKGGEARQMFLHSAACCEALHARGIRTADLCRNRGNAALLAGDVAKAILAYRQGLRLAPDDRELRENLSYARRQVAYPDPAQLGARSVSRHGLRSFPMPVVFQFLIAGILYSLGWLGVTRWLMVRRPLYLAMAGLALVGAGLLAANLTAEVWQKHEDSLHPLVVIASDGVLVRSGNGLSYPPRYSVPLNRGVEAHVLFTRNAWLQIELAGGEVGWIQRSQALVDES
jgi:hypothetical protein